MPQEEVGDMLLLHECFGVRMKVCGYADTNQNAPVTHRVAHKMRLLLSLLSMQAVA